MYVPLNRVFYPAKKYAVGGNTLILHPKYHASDTFINQH